MMRYDGGMQSGALPMPSLACATASLTAAELIAARRREMREARAMAVEHFRKRGLIVHPERAPTCSWSTGRPGRPRRCGRPSARQSVEIGRSWPIWPTVSRVTVGSMAEMTAFCSALDKVWA